MMIMDALAYMSHESFTWDGGHWTARSLAMDTDRVARELQRGRFGPMDSETARALSTGGTFDVTGGHEVRTFTVVHADGKSRVYQRTGDAVKARREFPGR